MGIFQSHCKTLLYRTVTYLQLALSTKPELMTPKTKNKDRNKIKKNGKIAQYKHNVKLPSEIQTMQLNGKTMWCSSKLTKFGLKNTTLSYSNGDKCKLSEDLCLRKLESHISSSNNFLPVLPTGEIVSSSVDNTIKIWNMTKGKCVKTLYGHTDYISCVSLSPLGELISGSLDHTIRVWDLSTDNCVRILKGHTSWVQCLVVAYAGELISGSWDHSVKIWDLTSGACVKTLHGHASPINYLFVLSNSYELISVAMDNTKKIWDLKSGRCLKTEL